MHRSRRLAKKKRGRPESIHHMSGRKVDGGGKEPIVDTKLESVFFTVKTGSLDHANVWSTKLR